MREKVLTLTKKDFRVDTFRSGGKGGQHQNKTDSGVRITHIDSGISSESRESRSQIQNKKLAFKKLLENYKFRHYIESLVRVEDAMKPENIKVEYFSKTGWVEGNNNEY